MDSIPIGTLPTAGVDTSIFGDFGMDGKKSKGGKKKKGSDDGKGLHAHLVFVCWLGCWCFFALLSMLLLLLLLSTAIVDCHSRCPCLSHCFQVPFTWVRVASCGLLRVRR